VPVAGRTSRANPPRCAVEAHRQRSLADTTRRRPWQGRGGLGERGESQDVGPPNRGPGSTPLGVAPPNRERDSLPRAGSIHAFILRGRQDHSTPFSTTQSGTAASARPSPGPTRSTTGTATRTAPRRGALGFLDDFQQTGGAAPGVGVPDLWIGAIPISSRGIDTAVAGGRQGRPHGSQPSPRARQRRWCDQPRRTPSTKHEPADREEETARLRRRPPAKDTPARFMSPMDGGAYGSPSAGPSAEARTSAGA